jgi:hypothetical protein
MTVDEIYEDLMKIVTPFGADVDFPLEAELFLAAAVDPFTDKGECLQFVQEHASDWFRSIADPPDWLQEAEWQFDAGRPMTFVGQLPIPVSTGYLHDDAALFVFWNPENGFTKTVIQVA